MKETPVLIAGGGPVGLVLALELAHRGVHAMLVERNLTTTRHPKMDITNGRSMEHFRRLGLADELRGHAVPPDHPLAVIWCTRVAEWELARFSYPTVESQRESTRTLNDGTQPLEPGMRISQVVLEPLLKAILEERMKHITVRFGWALVSFEQDADGVTSVIRSTETGATETIRSQYLAGCDGAGSVVRTGLGIEIDEISMMDLLRENLGTWKILTTVAKGLLHGQRPTDKIYLIHFTSKDREFFERFGTAWHLQSPGGVTVIAQNDLDTWTLHYPVSSAEAATLDPKQALFKQLGREIDCQIIVANAWQPRLVLARSYGKGRVWLAGDAAHQYVPTGGYGMNTGVGDAVDLGWTLAATIAGWGGPGLLPSYGIERHAIGLRNRGGSARHLAVRMLISDANTSQIHEDSDRGAQARRELGQKILELGNLENEALGIEIGYRYDTSPVICQETGTPPAYEVEHYQPTTWPGARPPSVFLKDGSAIFDRFGTGFTLLRFADVDVSPLERAAADRGIPFEVVDVRDQAARRLYERDLVLIRPDQHVAWRGDVAPRDPLAIVDRVRGANL